MESEGLTLRLRGGYKGYTGDFCCVPGCSNSRGKCNRQGLNVSFYKFPVNERRKSCWSNLIRRDVITTENGLVKQAPFVPKPSSRVCSVHFVGGKKIDDPAHPAYAPTIFPRNERRNRLTSTSKKAGISTLSPAPNSGKSPSVHVTPVSAGRPRAPKKLNFLSVNEYNPNAVWNTSDHDYLKCETSPTGEPCVNPPPPIVNTLQARFDELKGKLLRLDNIKSNDSKFQFWTNLPNYSVFSALSTYLKTRTVNGNLCYWRGEATNATGCTTAKGPPRKLSFEDEFFLVLVKLKTGKFNDDLAHTFDVSAGHVSNIFSTWINFLSNELKLLFEMQNSENNIPLCYKPFETLKVVLDCTELMVQSASNLDARKKTFSNYKHHDTVKFLAGISPNLAVNYVSRAWGGRASDKHITLSSNELMNKLTKGDTVMADRGFLISHGLKQKGVQLLMPEFNGHERVQFSKCEASSSEFISSARIHIERVIQRIKTFSFLEKVIRLNMHDIIEQIFLVCAYLTNFQLPVIKQ